MSFRIICMHCKPRRDITEEGQPEHAKNNHPEVYEEYIRQNEENQRILEDRDEDTPIS